MPSTQMQPNTDYIFCDECQEHVPCLRLSPGVWEVQCPRCVGECAWCGCHLMRYCFGQDGGSGLVRMQIVKAREKTSPQQPNRNK